MIEGQPHITALILGSQPTMNQAGAGAEDTGRAMAKGQPFNCVRGQGRLTLAQCLERFLGGHPVCVRDCGCSLGKRVVEKNPTAEETMSYRDIYGDCACGKTGVKLDKNGRCYKCQESVREAAKEERKARVIGPAAVAPEEPVAAVQGAQEPDDGQGWPETAGRLVVEGFDFVAIPSGKNAKIRNAVVSFRSAAIAFSADAVRKHGLDKFKYLRMHKAPGAVGFELLTEPGPNTRTMCRQAKDTVALSCTIHRLKEIFPGLSGRRFDLEATARPGFYFARVG